jgi:predicted Kef-type K+ transport protein
MLYGRVVTGILIAQDVAVVLLVIVLPALAGGSDHVLADLALAALKATGIILAAYLAGVRAVPWRLGQATVTWTREVFVLGVVLILGMSGRVAVLTGLSLAQVGEFSFVLAKVGVDTGAIPSSLFDLTLGLALVTIVLTPALLSLAPPLLGALSRVPFVGDRWIDPVGDEPAVEGLRRHVVICGYGRAGRELAETLTRRGLR